ncbi:hypothetical protein NDU88_000877 [Pleurodeles waltl]|uniref:Myb/SANT-like DNA-binding domain-containing protein n=1 Tax=Pleurodeles waltl TaxID=8319 RepID=A0AAV7LZD0_PLEWA|nr:hypothetical protein NDU88_000877 [Pleurodeles waltl]
MAAASGERAPALTAQELEKLVDGVLPQYTLLYGPPDQQVSAHQKRDIWRAIAKEVCTLGAHQRRGTHCRKRWEDIRRCSKKTAEAQLGMASQRGRGARRTMTPLMFRILAVTYPELDGRLRASQQIQGASSGGGTVAPEHEGAASHVAMEGHTTDSECTSGTEGEGSFTLATGSPSSDADSSADGGSLVVAAPSVPPTSTGTAATSPTSTALPAAPQRSPRARSPRRVGITFAPGTSSPAPVTPAAISEEAIDLLRSLTVGQSTIVNAIQGVERELQHGNAFLEGIHSGQAVLQRTLQSLASALLAAIVPVYVECTGHQGRQCDPEPRHWQPTPCKGSEIGEWTTGPCEDSWWENNSHGFQGDWRVSCDSTKGGEGQRKSAQPVVSITAEKGAIIPGGRDPTASTVVTGQETTATAGVSAQEGPSIVTGLETTATAGVSAQEGPSIVTGQETTTGVSAQEGPSIVTDQETTATAGVSAQEGPGIVTGQDTTAGVIAQEGPSIITGQKTTTGVSAQEGPSIVTGQETAATAGVSAQEGPGIVTSQETAAGVIAQEGPSIVTGQETTAGVSTQEGPGCHSPGGL